MIGETDHASDTDLSMQSEIFIIVAAMLLLLYFVAVNLAAHQSDTGPSPGLEQQLEAAQREVRELQGKQRELQGNLDRERAQRERLRQPPLITLDEASGYDFRTGSADINEKFATELRGPILQRIIDYARDYHCDILDVYGHADGVPYSEGGHWYRSELDDHFLKALQAGELQGLHPASNLELGMLRAGVVVALLRGLQRDGRLEHNMVIRPYSAGQAILPSGMLAPADDLTSDPKRRRIEIRLSRSADLHRAQAEAKQD